MDISNFSQHFITLHSSFDAHRPSAIEDNHWAELKDKIMANIVDTFSDILGKLESGVPKVISDSKDKDDQITKMKAEIDDLTSQLADATKTIDGLQALQSRLQSVADEVAPAAPVDAARAAAPAAAPAATDAAQAAAPATATADAAAPVPAVVDAAAAAAAPAPAAASVSVSSGSGN